MSNIYIQEPPTSGKVSGFKFNSWFSTLYYLNLDVIISGIVIPEA